jgi:hypothetical protein
MSVGRLTFFVWKGCRGDKSVEESSYTNLRISNCQHEGLLKFIEEIYIIIMIGASFTTHSYE